jgi:hypothetical protein
MIRILVSAMLVTVLAFVAFLAVMMWTLPGDYSTCRRAICENWRLDLINHEN